MMAGAEIGKQVQRFQQNAARKGQESGVKSSKNGRHGEHRRTR
jgi:hypothetical protein